VRILFASAECVPFAKVGGLGDVVGALPKALAQLGHDVRVVIPKYGFIPDAELDHHLVPLGVPLGGGDAWCAVLEAELPGSRVPIYFLEHAALFDGPNVYEDDGTLRGLARFGLLSRGALQLAKHLDWVPEVVHVHDWPTALVPVMLNTVEKNAFFGRTASVLTIHNIAYQPKFPAVGIDLLGVGWDVYKPDGLEDFGDLNLFKGGCYHATMLTTVSPTYAQEIRGPIGGNGLDHVMRARGADLVGILNGIDEEVWDPATDRHLPANFDADDLSGKATCKRVIQEQVGLDPRPEVPLFTVVSRLTPQKGIDVIAAVLERILELDAQLIVLGSGDPALEAHLRARSDLRDGKFYAWIGHNEPLAHRLEAAGDFFLMPSRFEPCGLNQMYSQRYGTIPIVRATGGLEDTVEQCDPVERTGTGFKLVDLTEESLLDTIRRAVSVYREDPELLGAMQLRGMRREFGWRVAAKRYEEVYRWATARKGSTVWHRR
jgi:starch synthase